MHCIIINQAQEQVNMLQQLLAANPAIQLTGCFDPDLLNPGFDQALFSETDIAIISLQNAQPREKILRFLQQNCICLFTSTDPSDAVLGYELNADDFILLPASAERFARSVEKAQQLLQGKSRSTISVSADEYIFLKSGSQIHRINLDDILYLEKNSNYFILHFRENRKLLIRTNFSALLSMLPGNKFMRVHKSYVIGFKHIDYIEGNNIIVNKEQIPIAITYKHQFMKVINA